jgi:hypothetical protein
MRSDAEARCLGFAGLSHDVWFICPCNRASAFPPISERHARSRWVLGQAWMALKTRA